MAAKPLSVELMQQAIDAIATHGNVTAAARAMALPRETLNHRYYLACAKGLKPQVQALLAGENAAPGEGYKLKGTSTLYGEDGKAKLQWVKTDASLEALRQMQEAAFKALCEKLEPLSRIAAPRRREKDLATLYTITDAHIGMLSWDKETGEDWDLTIAEQCLVDTLVMMIDAAPDSEVGIVNELGDYEHFDSLVPMTPTSMHILDADSRFQKMIQVAVRILRRIIEHALSKHNHIYVQIKEGNHNPAASAWRRVMFTVLYANNPRVKIDMSPNPYTVHQHGTTFLGFYHGHLAKLPSVPLLFAAQFPKEWGATEYRYIHTGHRHHVDEKEHAGVRVIQHPTLAAPDAYAARSGFLSKRQATSMTYHLTQGEIARATFVPVRRACESRRSA